MTGPHGEDYGGHSSESAAVSCAGALGEGVLWNLWRSVRGGLLESSDSFQP